MHPFSVARRILLVGCLSSSVAHADKRLSVQWSPDGTTYNISVDRNVWFSAGDTFATAGGVTYSSSDGSLRHTDGPIQGTGSDSLGEYTSVMHAWAAGSTLLHTGVRVYSALDTAIFYQTWPHGAFGTNRSDAAAFKEAWTPKEIESRELPHRRVPDVSSCFPSIALSSDVLGYVSFSGRFLEASRGGALKPGSLPEVGHLGGPFVVLSNASSDSLVFSAASRFMEASWGAEADGRTICSGTVATITSAPEGYTLETMVYLGSGVNSAMKGFGSALMTKYNTKRVADYTLKHLGYSTDNGAYYYYLTEKGVNYEQTLMDVYSYAESVHIPYKYILLDSWWYTKGHGSGVKEWDATVATFPDGLGAFHKKTGWFSQLHNRHWSNDNVYARQNGGGYDFIVEDPLAIPVEQRFWDDLIANKSDAGLVVYEQDWMYNEWEGLNATLTSSSLADKWLTQMGQAAEKSGVAVQYCMSYARMVLHSVEVNAVTNFRAGDDYHPGQTGYFPTAKDPSGQTGCRFPYCVYYIGTSSIVAYALGLAPAKDDFWSTPLQPDSPYGNDTAEPYSEMEAAISAYSTGPVQPSDAVGRSNATLILMTCTSGGRLLQPSAPARAIDACFYETAFGGEGKLGPVPRTEHNHAVMATHTEVSGFRWLHVLVIGLARPFSLRPSHVAGELSSAASPPPGFVAWSGYGPRNVTLRGIFSEDRPMQFPACGYADFGLWHAAPVFEGGIAFLGEVAKFVPVALARIASVTRADGGLVIGVRGEPAERVELAFAALGEAGTPLGTVTYVVVQLSDLGEGTVTWPGAPEARIYV
mmetsp:Transcript_3597/g.9206  ORF Transcript_3597/g.9206 Transcript_3597/m.9206 type:complete len:812 (-) Transcript_3597:141-2576(-)